MLSNTWDARRRFASADFSTRYLRNMLTIMIRDLRIKCVEKSADAPSIASITKHIL